MATLLKHERPLAAAILSFSTKPVWGALAAAGKHARQRKALASLMELDDRRLDDIGLCREDIREAMRSHPRSLGEVFAARRVRAARRGLTG